MPEVQEALTVPATVAFVPATVLAVDAVGSADALGDDVADSGTVPGDADASTRDTARKPSPTAEAAEAVHAVPRRRVRFMGQSLRSPRLRASQGSVKARRRFGRSGGCGG
jgi:hypothetical protein